MWQSFLQTSVILASLISQTLSCSDEPQCLFGSKYVLVQAKDTSRPVSWAEAEGNCSLIYGTHLASIHSAEDLADSIRACKRAKGIDKCWIGLTDGGNENENNWRWSDGTTYDSSLNGWAPGEPTGNFVSELEDCVYISPEKGYGWNDFSCTGDWTVDRNIKVFSYLCNNPDYNPELECRCECDVCSIEGDPHITTFDNLLYHFMGNCTYLYVTPCFNNYQNLPIQISGSHVQCFEGRNDRTCLHEVYINLFDSNNNIAAQLKLGENYFAQFTGVGNLNWNGNVILGNYYQWNSNPVRLVRIIRTSGLLDVRFYWYDISQQEDSIMDARVQVAKTFNPNGWGAFVDIWLAQCYATSEVCGLCGLYNFNALDDFHYIDTNNNLAYISTTGVSEVKTMTIDAWQRTHEFGYKWLNLNINNLENKQCIVEGEPPNPECSGTAEQYCAQFWQYDCDCNGDLDYYNNTWFQSCVWDTCSLCVDLNEMTYQEAYELGCFAFANITCENNCLPVNAETMSPTYVPTNRPTKRPTFQPTRRPTFWPTSRPTYSPTSRPTYWPTKNPTNQPTRSPTNRPTPTPSFRPTNRPTNQPTFRPTNRPTNQPSPQPTPRPTNQPTPLPTPRPSPTPTLPPIETIPQAETTTVAPTINYWWRWVTKPTNKPTNRPTPRPTPRPTARPTLPPIQTNPQAETTENPEQQYWWYWNNKNSNNKNSKPTNKGKNGN